MLCEIALHKLTDLCNEANDLFTVVFQLAFGMPFRESTESRQLVKLCAIASTSCPDSPA